ncbi:DUF2834 domain-containing protein [Streptomyces sp. NPDC059957]|uniref:DUF2834 domain-containing protein n=1 Tax=Streptomyces sp. NPDC059957 TaxID=3347016 RepID=UPI00364BBF54
MTRLSEVRGKDRALCFLYGASALIGLCVMGTMAVTFVVQNADAGAMGVVENFLRDSTTNLASQFVYMDLVLVWAAVGAYMIVEGRRFGIRHVWAYIVGAPAIALIVTYGLFMLVRQLKIAALREAEGERGNAERSFAAEEFADVSALRPTATTATQ